MGFEIGKNVQGSDITLAELQSKLKGEKLQQKAATIFSQFNTNQTVNDKGQQVLDTTEQVALISFFKEIAGGKKSDSKDTNLGRGDLRNFKKNNKEGNFAFIQDLGYGDMKKIMKAFSGVVEADSDVANNDNLEISEWTQENGDVKSVMIDGKKYTIDKDNNITDADGVKYEYKDGKLTKKEDGNTTTTFDKGVRSQAVKQEGTVTLADGTTYYVQDGKVTIADQEYEVVDGKINFDGQEIKVDTKETTTTYRAGGNTRAQEVVADSSTNTVVTTDFQADGKTRAKQVVQNNADDTTITTSFKPDGVGKVKEEKVDNKNHTTTTTNFQTDGKTKAKEVVVDKSNANSPKTTTTNYNVSGSLVNRTIEEGKGDNVKTTKIDYSAKTQTITQGNVETVETFNTYNSETGNVSGENSNIAKRVVTNKADHSRTTTEPAKNTTIKTVELLDDNNKSVQRTVKFDATKKTATFTVNGKTVTLATDSKGNILANRLCKGLRMENLEEAVTRLGFQKGSAEYNAIIAANRGNKGAIKIPESVANLRGLNVQTAEVDAAAERRKLNNNIIANREANRASYGKQAFERQKGALGLRETWASASMQVYCTNDANVGGKGYNQHYIYDAKTNGLVKLESYLGISGGKYIDRITDNGYARLNDGSLVKINIKTRTTTESTVTDYNKSFTESATKGAKGEIAGTVDKEKHQFVYQGDTRTNVLTDKKELLYDNEWVSPEEYVNRLSDSVYAEAVNKSGGTAVKGMYDRIAKNVNADNVLEFYETYQARHSGDSSVVDTMTSEWLDYGKGHGRDYTVKTTVHIVNQLIERARKAGVADKDLQAALNFVQKDRTHYINDSNGRGTSYADGVYSREAEPVINNLIQSIKVAENAPASEEKVVADAGAATADEVVTEEVVEEVVAEEEVPEGEAVQSTATQSIPSLWGTQDLKADSTYLNAEGKIIGNGSGQFGFGNSAMKLFINATVETITVMGKEQKAVKMPGTEQYYDWESLKDGFQFRVFSDPKEA